MQVTFVNAASEPLQRNRDMGTITTKDGVQIFYKDWGHGQPIVFHHGWPLSSDDWDAQMLFFVLLGFRVVGIDRRGHGRSSQVSDGHDMDHYAEDAASVVEHLDLRDTVHIGHSTGGGEVARYVARYGKGRVTKAVLMSAVPPIMVKTPENPDGLPIEVFNGWRNSLAANRAQFYRDVPGGPFYGFNRPGAKPLEGVIENWWRAYTGNTSSSCRTRGPRKSHCWCRDYRPGARALAHTRLAHDSFGFDTNFAGNLVGITLLEFRQEEFHGERAGVSLFRELAQN
jgi:non-heme chloroperoxidase